ncbi:MAG TPA: NAD(P)-dependent oxidoreductase [Bacteroidia bacterium]|jgi:UDP-glucose 4-epimerase|nr:NAD(P)-dependent oxidoreductase [Bacteroidia bacterium]
MKIILSGGSGYIGTKLIQKLLDAGEELTVLSRSENDFLRSLKKEKIELVLHDLASGVMPPERTGDVFIHTAAANDIDSVSPSVALSSTVLTTRQALEYCVKNRIPKFIYFSTFQVYGKVEGEMNESTEITPVNDYGLTHFFAEEYVRMYQRKHAVSYIILRPTNIYGSPVDRTIDRWSLVPNCFCKEAAETGRIILQSSGKQTRDFVNLEDLAGITHSFCRNFDAFSNRSINVSSGNNYTILEIAELVKERYEEIYPGKCVIEIRSDQPSVPNEYQIDRETMLATGFRFGDRKNIVAEIDRTFQCIGKTNKPV